MSSNRRPSWTQSIDAWMHRREGKMTRELEREKLSPHLPQLPTRMKPDAVTHSVCGYCSTGCSLKIHLRDEQAIGLSPHHRYPVNQGMACPKGWESLTVLDAPDRGTTPLLRNQGGERQAVSWDVATQTFVERFQSVIDRHGIGSVAWLSTGQIATEEMAYLGALAKFGMGWLHGDGNTRQCMATAVAAYQQSFGFDAPPYAYADLEASDVILLIGSNLCIAHPILWQRVMQNPHRPRIIVIDPRNTETAQLATDHFAIRPKSDLEFFYGIAHILLQNGWIDRDFIDASTTEFEAFASFLQPYTAELASAASGIPVSRLQWLTETIASGKRVSFWWTMGVNQGHQSTRTAQAIINLALMTGNIGKPGTGANSITGQCNAMGSRLFSNTTSLLGGHDFLNASHRQRVAERLNMPVERIPASKSLAYDQIMEGIRDGSIRGLWVIATNPAHSWIHQNDARKLLQQLDFLVVQDMYTRTETAQLADLFLPAAGWGEKQGTFINSERRIGLIRQVKSPPGEALSDFDICQRIATAYGCESLLEEWRDPESVFGILARLSEGQPCDFSAIQNYEMIAANGGIQWPLRPEDIPAQGSIHPQRRLFENGQYFHPDGRAKFLFEPAQAMPEAPSASFPLLLITGRGTSAQWHTQTRTEKSPILRKLYPAHPYLEMHPDDAAQAGLHNGKWVCVESSRGRIEVVLRLSNTVSPGMVFIPMHYAVTNQLTFPAFDPHSRQPSYKACAVRIFPKEH